MRILAGAAPNYRIGDLRLLGWPSQIILGLLVSVWMPAYIRYLWDGGDFRFASLSSTLLVNSAAFLVGGYFLWRLTSFPGVKSSNYILPTFFIAFSTAALAMFMLRFQYSRFLFASSAFITIGWFYAWHFLVRGFRPLRLALVPGGKARMLPSRGRVEWLQLENPRALPQNADAVVADLRADLGADWEAFLADCAISGIPVFHSKQVAESLTGQVEIEHLSENTLGSLFPSLAYRNLKRLADVVVAILLLPFVLPLFAAIAVLIRLDSSGPILFRQERIGYGGKPFQIYKFRSMAAMDQDLSDAGEIGLRTQAMTVADDPRITRFGAFLRRTRLDELPQIFNILKGEMSWIGPRPEAVELSVWYERQVPFYRYRHIVRPGISGWAQVNQGHVTSVPDVLVKLHYDFFYIKHFSLWLDVLIVFRTLRVVFFGHGAK